MQDDFYGKLAVTLERDEVAPGDVLEDFEEWDSLSVLSVVAMIGSGYGVHLSAREIRSVRTAKDLVDLVLSKTPA